MGQVYAVVPYSNEAKSWPNTYSCFDRQRFSHKSVKAYATMSIGIMGIKNLVCLIEVQGDSASRNEKERLHVDSFVCQRTLRNVRFLIE